MLFDLHSYVAGCCSVLQCVAVHCSELQYVAVCCSVLQKYLQHEHASLQERQSNYYYPRAAFQPAAAIPKSLKVSLLSKGEDA